MLIQRLLQYIETTMTTTVDTEEKKNQEDEVCWEFWSTAKENKTTIYLVQLLCQPLMVTEYASPSSIRRNKEMVPAE